MDPVLAKLAEDMQKLASQWIPRSYQLGKEKGQRRYNVIRPWGDRDNVNVALLLEAHSHQLAKTMAGMEIATAAGSSLSTLLEGLAGRSATWSWVLSPALAMGLASYVDETRAEIGQAEAIPANDIGVIWLTAEDQRVCSKCLYLAGRWFDARTAYDIAARIHPGCRCPAHFDVGTPDEAMVGPLETYRPGTAQEVYQNLHISELAGARVKRARRMNTPPANDLGVMRGN